MNKVKAELSSKPVFEDLLQKRLSLYMNTATQFYIDKQYEQAVKHFQIAEKFICHVKSHQELSNAAISDYLTCLYFLAVCHIRIKNDEAAEPSLLTYVEIMRNLTKGDKDLKESALFLASAHIKLACIKQRQCQFSASYEYLTKATTLLTPLVNAKSFECYEYELLIAQRSLLEQLKTAAQSHLLLYLTEQMSHFINTYLLPIKVTRFRLQLLALAYHTRAKALQADFDQSDTGYHELNQAVAAYDVLATMPRTNLKEQLNLYSENAIEMENWLSFLAEIDLAKSLEQQNRTKFALLRLDKLISKYQVLEQSSYALNYRAVVHSNKGAIYLKQGQKELAIAAYIEVNKINDLWFESGIRSAKEFTVLVEIKIRLAKLLLERDMKQQATSLLNKATSLLEKMQNEQRLTAPLTAFIKKHFQIISTLLDNNKLKN